MEPGEPQFIGEYLPVQMLFNGGASTWCGGWETVRKFEMDDRPTALLLMLKDKCPGTDTGLTIDQIPLPNSLKKGEITEIIWRDQTLGIVVYTRMRDTDKLDLSFAAVYSNVVSLHKLNGYNLREEANAVSFKKPENLTEAIKTLTNSRK